MEDDETIGSVLAAALPAQGLPTTWASTAAEALERCVPGVELVLLDLGLPDMDGVALCRLLRERAPDLVIVVLSARSDELDVVLGLHAGADDYLVKPVRFQELLARVQAHLRRAHPAANPVTAAGALVVDVGARRAMVGSSEVVLAPREFDLLERLTRDAGAVVTRESLMSDVWDAHWHGSTKTLDVHVASVRQRLAAGAEHAGVPIPRITTVRGIGYRLEA